MKMVLWIILSGVLILPAHPSQIPSKKTVIVAPGDDAILGCVFTATASLNINNLIINWQHSNTVVHSFYQVKDQLDRQGQTYRGRTHLFEKEILKGNASLALKDVQPKDHGEYVCDVSDEHGATKHTVQLIVAAPYEDPKLAIHYNCDNVIVTLTSSQGFPEPTVSWKHPFRTYVTATELDTKGRYRVYSNLTVTLNTTLTAAVEVKLKELSQSLTKEITLHPQPRCCVSNSPHNRHKAPLLLSIGLIIATLLWILFATD